MSGKENITAQQRDTRTVPHVVHGTSKTKERKTRHHAEKQ